MSATAEWKIVRGDLEILRSLARRIREISQTPENLERKRLWLAHSRLRQERPMVLIEAGGVEEREMPDEYNRTECSEKWAADLERQMRSDIYRFERIADDAVIEPCLNCAWFVEKSNYGVEAPLQHGENPEGIRGSYRWDPPIRDIDADFDKLHPRTFSVDREKTLAWKAHLEEVFDGILAVRIRGGFWWTMGMTWEAIKLVGLEALMLLMYDDPKGLHRLMKFLRDDHLAFAEWLEAKQLFSLNNENDYIGSGSIGYTEALPGKGYAEGAPVRLKDIWVLLESQETVGVGPGLFEEFIFPYQLSIAERFGLCYYGCCEPVHSRWHIVKRIPNLQRVSVSPWCDQDFMADALGRDYAFCRKPPPSLISTDRFDDEAIREDLRTTLRTAAGCNIELVMKDVHTLRGHPERLGRWVEIAREAIAEGR